VIGREGDVRRCPHGGPDLYMFGWALILPKSQKGERPCLFYVKIIKCFELPSDAKAFPW